MLTYHKNAQYGYATVSGTVGDPDCTITVNGVPGTNYGDGTWAADNVLLSSGGTVTLQVTAQLAGGAAPQTLLEQDRGPIVFTQISGLALAWTMVWTNGSSTAQIQSQWTRGGGGTSTETGSWVDFDTGNVTSYSDVTVWPADNGYWPTLPGQQVINSYFKGVLTDSYTNTTDPPSVEWMEESMIAGSWPADFGVIYSESSGRKIKLFTGGKALRQSQSLFDLSAALTIESELDPNVPDWGGIYPGFSPFLEPGEPPVAVLSQQISLDALGKLDNDGHLAALQPDGMETGITPQAPATSYTGPSPSAPKYKLITVTVSPTPTNRARSTIGVGEEVDISLSPALTPYAAQYVGWTTSAGSVYPRVGNQTRLTAPPNLNTATVIMQYRSVAFPTKFEVIQPTGYDHADFEGYWTYTSTTLAGAGVYLQPFIGPINVSFYRVQVMEVGEDATDVSGYFTMNTPPSHKGNGADAWIDLDYDNHWKGNYDCARSSGWGRPWYGSGWSGGSYTWNIPALWRVVGTSGTNSMTGWNQVHQLGSDGTMTVTKFGHSVSRTIQGVYSGQ